MYLCQFVFFLKSTFIVNNYWVVVSSELGEYAQPEERDPLPEPDSQWIAACAPVIGSLKNAQGSEEAPGKLPKAASLNKKTIKGAKESSCVCTSA